MTDGLDEARAWLAASRRTLVMTGAGVSAESGVPTFRGDDGYWKDFNPEELASPEGFARDPVRVWEWYAGRIRQLETVKPNPAHDAIARLEARGDDFLLLTQNVDGLHQRAGSRNVHEIHGSLQRVRCFDTGRRWGTEEVSLDPPYPVKTPEGRIARPDVVWFGEIIDMDAHGAVDAFIEEATPDVCLVIGTSALFGYIQEWVARCNASGSKVIEINPTPALPRTWTSAQIAGKAGETMAMLVE